MRKFLLAMTVLTGCDEVPRPERVYPEARRGLETCKVIKLTSSGDNAQPVCMAQCVWSEVYAVATSVQVPCASWYGHDVFIQ